MLEQLADKNDYFNKDYNNPDRDYDKQIWQGFNNRFKIEDSYCIGH